MENKMKFHIEQVKDYFSSPVFNKNKNKIFMCLAVVGVIIFGMINTYLYLQTQLTVPVCVFNKSVPKNALITDADISVYQMTKKEYKRYSLVRTSNGVNNRIVKWEDRARITQNKEPIFIGLTKMAGDFLRYDQIMGTQQDNSRAVLSLYPGKSIVELDMSISNLNTWKKRLQVNDKINITCSYNTSNEQAVSITEASGSAKKKTLDMNTFIVKDVFTGVVVADIMNTQGDSLLDYYQDLNQLTAKERLQAELSDEYATKTKVNNILLALTPAEEKRYRTYSNKNGIKFYITPCQIDD